MEIKRPGKIISTMNLFIYNCFKYSIKAVFWVSSVLYSLPTYVIWMTLLTPLRIFTPDYYWMLEAHMCRMLQGCVVSWLAGYKFIESGDDIMLLHDKEAIIMSNHQSTADTPLLMCMMYLKKMAGGTLMWILWAGFKYTNFGICGMHRGDFLIEQGRNTRDLQLVNLKKHLETKYLQNNKRWIGIFPEGGFLYKRLETSQRYARANNYPVLHYCTLPRIGSVKTVIETLGEPYDPTEPGSFSEPFTSNSLERLHDQKDKERPLKWLVDVTIAYKGGEPLDFIGMSVGYNKPEDILMHYRAYRAKDIPRGEKEITDWLYERYQEKDDILAHYYKTGELPPSENEGSPRLLPQMVPSYARFDVLHQVLVQGFFLASTYVHYYYIVKPLFSLLLSPFL